MSASWVHRQLAGPVAKSRPRPSTLRWGDLAMDEAVPSAVYQFENFQLDCGAGAMFRLASDGGRTEVPLGSRALLLARVLIERRGEVVSRQQIMDTVWPNLAVEENNL